MSVLSLANRMPSSHSRAEVPVLPVLWTSPVRARPQLTNLEQALDALCEAQRMIQSQEDRILYLENLNKTDELTGLLNRNGFYSAIRRELVVSRRTEKHAGLLITINMDDFSQINDIYGREVGDNCLQTMASLLINEIRTSDYAARLEKDSFAVLLPDISMKAAGKRLEELERTVNNRVMHSHAHAIQLRASFGFSILHETETPDSLMMAADQKLYISKSRRKMGMKG